MLGDRLADPALGVGVGHPVATEQHRLVVERQPGDLPTHREALEEQLRAPPPGVLDRGGLAGRRLADLGDRSAAERFAQGQHVALGIGVVDRRDLLALAPFLLALRHHREFASCASGRGRRRAKLDPVDELVLIGVPIDSVGRDGGAELAPAALRDLGLATAIGALDEGDLEVRVRGEQRDPATGILAGPDVLATTATIRTAVAEQIAAGRRPFLAGGCCAELPGALAGARDALGSVGLVHLDGHLDLYDGETSPTGEAADMPVSVALGLGPAGWVEAAGGASVSGGRTAIVGFRDREESVEYGMRQPQDLEPTPLLRSAAELRSEDPGTAAAEVAVQLGQWGGFWLHVDVDVLDREVFPATDYLMPDGLDWPQLRAALGPLLSSPALIGASVACYNPEKDPDRACGRALVEALGAALAPKPG